MDELRVLLLTVCCFQSLLANYYEVRDFSRCIFPCSLRGKNFTSSDGAVVATFSTEDPREVLITTDTSVLHEYCIDKVGPFYVQGRAIDGVNKYACYKDTHYDTEGAIMIFNQDAYKPYVGRPDICQVCDGSNMDLVGSVDETKDYLLTEQLGNRRNVQAQRGATQTKYETTGLESSKEKVVPKLSTLASKELGCNIPWFCPVVNATTQKQCSQCEPSELDDGCCA